MTRGCALNRVLRAELLRTVLPAPLWPTMMVSGLKNSITSVLSGAKLRMPLISSCAAAGCVSTASTKEIKQAFCRLPRHLALGKAHLLYAAHRISLGGRCLRVPTQLRDVSERGRERWLSDMQQGLPALLRLR